MAILLLEFTWAVVISTEKLEQGLRDECQNLKTKCEKLENKLSEIQANRDQTNAEYNEIKKTIGEQNKNSKILTLGYNKK